MEGGNFAPVPGILSPALDVVARRIAIRNEDARNGYRDLRAATRSSIDMELSSKGTDPFANIE